MGTNQRCQNEPKAHAVALFLMAETNSVPHCTDQPQNSSTAPLDGWRCDLCGEIVTAQERPILLPEKCPRCSSVYITSIEAWAARALLGLWTRSRRSEDSAGRFSPLRPRGINQPPRP